MCLVDRIEEYLATLKDIFAILGSIFCNLIFFIEEMNMINLEPHCEEYDYNQLLLFFFLLQRSINMVEIIY